MKPNLLIYTAICIYVLFIALLLFTDKFNSYDSTLQQVSKNVKDEKPVIETWYGTATAITDDGHYITAAHVVKNNLVLLISNSTDGATYLAKVVAIDFKNDIAIIKSMPITKYFIKHLDNTRIADKSISCGFSLFQVFKKCSYVEGHIANVENGVAYNDAAINHGDSGSGVINEQGELIGVVSGMYVSQYGVPVQKSGIYISSEPIKNLIQSAGIKLIPSSGKTLNQDSLAALVTGSSVIVKAAGFGG